MSHGDATNSTESAAEHAESGTAAQIDVTDASPETPPQADTATTGTDPLVDAETEAEAEKEEEKEQAERVEAEEAEAVETVEAAGADSDLDSVYQETTDEPELPARTYLAAGISSDLAGPAPPHTAATSLLGARQSEISIKFDAKDLQQQQAINLGSASIKKTFHDIESTLGHLPELLGGAAIDWAFWGRVVDQYDAVVAEQEAQLLAAVAAGIPKEIRGIIWQLVARSKSVQLEELYMHLKGESSVHERAIKRDLTRTLFFTNVDAANKADELFNVIKAYLNFDPDVGYTQGMAFIAVPLIINMTEAECFCLLVTLMKEYTLRNLFCPDMQGLHLLLHQFDRLLEHHLPRLYNHLARQGIRSLMYASQWFLTFFSYKFPLDVVLRIFDMVITQGIEAVLRLALTLMLRNEASLLCLNFDALLEFLKLNLFNVYVSDEYIKSDDNKRFLILRKTPQKAQAATNYYKLDVFIQDAMLVELSPLDLARYKLEFEQMCTRDAGRVSDIERLRADNGTLRHEIKALESDLFALNHEHIELVQTLVDAKVLLPEVLGDIEEARHAVAGLQADVQDLELKLGADLASLPVDIDTKIQGLLTENAAETERFANLEEQLSQLTVENGELKSELKTGKKWFW